MAPTSDLAAAPAAPPRLLQACFQAAAARWPEQLAVDVPPGPDRDLRRTATYADLSARAHTLAALLRPRLGSDAIVALHLSRDTPDLYAAQLAVLLAGGAWTCIDPAFPDDQVQAILDDAAPAAILADAAGAARLRGLRLGTDLVVDTAAFLATAPAAATIAPAPWQHAHSLAYLIYTSGTTGKPKGVMIQQAGITSLVTGDLAEFGLGPGDRVAQGSSAAYDSSVEETWLALASGATVVVMDDAAARLGPDLVPWLREERITVFCPPPTLLRATGCEDPATALPDLKLLYVGGEALPQDVADRWGQGRRLVNGYGPTECTVTALRTDIVPGRPITIGHPVPGLRAWVLNEALAEVPPGQSGELCIGGTGLARGYRNDPETTTLKFLEHPTFGRIYRTGDLALRGPDGAHHYLGRMDTQVKLRGYRIELEAIEARLVEHMGVRAAACTVQGEGARQTLVGFFVPEDPGIVPLGEHLKAWLRHSLPAYMVPGHLAPLAELPVTVGGKLDRRRLPQVRTAGEALEPGEPPRDATEAALARAYREALALAADAPIHADFFNDLGGDSLGAALLVSLLREDPATAAVTVRDIYEAPTIAELAPRLQASQRSPGKGLGDGAPLPRTRAQPPGPALALHTLCLLATLALGAPLTYLLTFRLLPALAQRLGLVPLLLLAPLLSALGLALWAPLSLAYAVLVKRLLIGRYQPLTAPVWGSFHTRNWMVQQAVRLVPWGLFTGTGLHAAALRALGARIGQRVHIHRGVLLLRGGWDLLDIGDDATLSQDVALQLVDLEAGQIKVGPITIGAGATLEVRASVDAHSEVGAGACLTALSHLPAGSRIPAGERWHGIPAQPAGRVPEAPALPPGTQGTSLAFTCRMLAARLALAMGLSLPADLLFVALALGSEWTLETALDGLASPTTIILLVLSVPLTLLTQALAAQALGPVEPGVLGRWSPAYLRVWLKSGLVDAAGQWLSGTLFWPFWLRLAGMRIGPGCEISTIIDVVPELVEIGPETFFADGIYLGGPRIHRGTVTVDHTVLGRNTFLGNHAVILAGQALPNDILLGVCTVADAAAIRPGSSWFGHPPFELPRREVVVFDRSLTHDPSTLRYLTRVFWEALRFTLPVFPALVFLGWVAAVTKLEASLPPAAFLGVALPLLTLATTAIMVLAILALKWLLLGRVRPGTHALWSCWCSRWDFLYVAWGFFGRGLLTTLEGTLWLTWYLRAMGMHIGARAVLGPGFAQVVDPDMISIGDGATVQAMFQAHTFEDRVLKIDHVQIHEGASLGHGTVPLYGAVIGAHADVAPHSVIMKRERLLPGESYSGAPTRVRSSES